MNMNKLRPYLFWVVCGVVVLIELVLLFFFTPTEDGKTPEAAKGEVDGAKKSLDKMYKQAKGAPSATQHFDPLAPADIQDLTDHYLATKAWEQPMKDELTRYSDQLGQIKAHLLARSKVLHEKISPAQNIEWYDAYVKVTANLLQTLYDAGCLQLPSKSGMPGGPPGMGPGMGPGMPGPSIATQGGSTPDSPDPKPDFVGDTSARAVAGFVTKQSYNDLQYDDLTLKYHIMQMIAQAIESASATNIASPAAPNKKPSESHVKLYKTTFAQEGTSDENVTVVTIDLEGPLSALLATEAALEENKNGDDAVRAVIGGKLWRPSYKGTEALHVSSEPVDMELQVAFMDFTDLTNVDTDVMPQQKAAPPPKAGSKPAAATVKTAAASTDSAE